MLVSIEDNLPKDGIKKKILWFVAGSGENIKKADDQSRCGSQRAAKTGAEQREEKQTPGKEARAEGPCLSRGAGPRWGRSWPLTTESQLAAQRT